MATVKGDIHDLGKNICSMMLKNFGLMLLILARMHPVRRYLALQTNIMRTLSTLSPYDYNDDADEGCKRLCA